MTGKSHPVDDLSDYVAGTLQPLRRRRLLRHLKACRSCRGGVEEWTATRHAVRSASPPAEAPSGEEMLGRIRERLDGRRSPRLSVDGMRLLHQVLAAQVPLLRERLWIGSALVMALGSVVSASLRSATGAGLVIALVAPVLAGLGVAVTHGPECDPRLELVLVTGTPPRVVMLARLLLVVGYDLALALVASGVVAAGGRSSIGLITLVDLWLGPMLLLASLSLVVSMRAGAGAGVSVTMALWALRVLAASDGDGLLGKRLAAVVKDLWSTSWVGVASGLVLVAAAWVSASPSRRELA